MEHYSVGGHSGLSGKSREKGIVQCTYLELFKTQVIEIIMF